MNSPGGTIYMIYLWDGVLGQDQSKGFDISHFIWEVQGSPNCQ